MDKSNVVIDKTKPVMVAPVKDRTQHSTPFIKKKITLNTLQAHRVMDRSFSRLSLSLFSIGVILRIIGDQDEMDEVEKVISDLMDNLTKEVAKAREQLKVVMESNGLDDSLNETLTYSESRSFDVEINSPQLSEFIKLVIEVDKLISIFDILWLSSIFSSKQRIDACFGWQQRLNKIAGRIIGIESRARIAAHTKGKQAEVDLEVPPVTDDLDDDLKAAISDENE